MNRKLEKQHLWEIEIFRNITRFVIFKQSNVSLLNKISSVNSVYLPVTQAHFKTQYDIVYKCLSMIIKLISTG